MAFLLNPNLVSHPLSVCTHPIEKNTHTHTQYKDFSKKITSAMEIKYKNVQNLMHRIIQRQEKKKYFVVVKHSQPWKK